MSTDKTNVATALEAELNKPKEENKDSDKKKAKPPSDGSQKNGPASEDTNLLNQYFFEDEVYRIDKKGRVKFGLVIETSEMYSGDEEEEYEEILDKDEVRIAWYPDGKEVVVQRDSEEIGLADRTLMPGDVVRRVLSGKDTQRGYCRSINMRADVQIVNSNYVIKNVEAERLSLLSVWQRDNAVCLDSWVGSVKEVEKKAILRTASGCRVEISSKDFGSFKELNYNKRGIFSPMIFFPGNIVVGRLNSVNFKQLSPNKTLPVNKTGVPTKEKFTIESVYTDAVHVHWQCKSLSEGTSADKDAMQQPVSCIKGEDLKRLKTLNLFEACMLQINDRSFLTYTSSDTVVKKYDWEQEQAAKFKAIDAALSSPNRTKLFETLKKNIYPSDSDRNTSTLKKVLVKIDRKKSLTHAEREILYSLPPQSPPPPRPVVFPPKIRKSDECVDTASKEASKAVVKDYSSDVDEFEDALDIDYNADHHSRNGDDTERDSATTTFSTGSSPSPPNSPKRVQRKSSHSNNTAKKKTSPSTRCVRKTASGSYKIYISPQEGDVLITEALLVYSSATVVWQDGSIEENIPSTDLYPIHHLDNHEFFPGDFVISLKESDFSFREYGVIQHVDHEGRTATVKWFTTYATSDEPKPTYNGVSEVSVYDLKDHPDFQYRPGTMVIRVANFVGDDALCTAGQIIDNFTDGRVQVWWVNDHISLCWPQDLFEVGQYDHGDWDHESEDSWETESEDSEIGIESPKMTIADSNILSNIERAQVAIARLEEIFNLNPSLQSQEVMRKLLSVYKGCRYLDRLLGTGYFHEENFLGLIERVRKTGSQSLSERAYDRLSRLFNDTPVVTTDPNQLSTEPPDQQEQQQMFTSTQSKTVCHYVNFVHNSKLPDGSNTSTGKEYAPKVLFNVSSLPGKSSSNTNAVGSSGGGSSSTPTSHKRKSFPSISLNRTDISNDRNSESTSGLYNLLSMPNTSTTAVSTPSNAVDLASSKQNLYNAERNQLLSTAMHNLEKAVEKTSHLKPKFALLASQQSASQNDSGTYSKNDSKSDTGEANGSSSDNAIADSTSPAVKANEDQKSASSSSLRITEDIAPEFICVRLCGLLKDQLHKFKSEINEKYCKEDAASSSDFFEISTIESEVLENFVDLIDIPEEQPTSERNEEDKEPPKSAKTEESKSERIIESIVDATAESAKYASEDHWGTGSLVAESLESVEHSEYFNIVPLAPKSHKFYLTVFQPNNPHQYYRAVQREHKVLRSAIPPGVWVKAYEDRVDLLSVMIEGPKKTPYEDGMFVFDIQLGREYPKAPPFCHYISYCADRLNPNLYEDGKVCVSLLGTWTGRDTEVWGPNSTLLQVIVSIQGLILVPEPYFNEAGYEKQKGTQHGQENSRMYNEMVIIKMVQAMAKMIKQPPVVFRDEVLEHFKKNGQAMYERIVGFMELSKEMANAADAEGAAAVHANEEDVPSTSQAQGTAVAMPTIPADTKHPVPDFPLVPASRGFRLALVSQLEQFKAKLDWLYSEAKCTSAESEKE